MLSRLERIKSFIDWVEEDALETLEEVEERGDLNEKFHEDNVKDVKEFLTCTALLWDDDEFNQQTLDNYFENDWWRDLNEYDAGIEQFCFIFNDGEVWKVSSFDVPQLLADMLHQIPSKYHFLFPQTEAVAEYKGCVVYKQELVAKKGSQVKHDYIRAAEEKHMKFCSDSSDNLEQFSDALYCALSLKFGEKWCDDFCDALADSGYYIDLHDNNWGLGVDDNILLFDAIFEEI